ncbi:MAG: FosX/FosE/FosI family fosfomycin resistance hydrolase [Pseudomonadota bacterium]
MIEGLSHITLVVSDLDRTEEVFRTVFDAKRVYDSGDDTFSISRERFFLIGGVWVAIMEGEPVRHRGYSHVAFKVDADQIGKYEERVKAAGLTLLPGRSRVPGEGQSVYFYDHDDYLFELHSGTLETRLQRYERGNPKGAEASNGI